MYDLHPPLVAFPLVLLSLLVLIEGLLLFRPEDYLQKSAQALLPLTGIAVVAAFVSGYFAGESADGTFQVPQEPLSWHFQMARLLLFLMVGCIALGYLSRRATHNVKLFKGAYLLILLSCFLLVVYTGVLGGELVFSYGAGVEVITATENSL